MGWIVFGFLALLGSEMVMRVLKNYEPEEKRNVSRTQVTMPWYGWALAGLSTYALWRGTRRNKKS